MHTVCIIPNFLACFSLSWSNSALELLWVNRSIMKTIMYLLWHEKTVYSEQFKVILVSQFPERQLLEYKQIFQCIEVCFFKKGIYFFKCKRSVLCSVVTCHFSFFRSQQHQEMSSFYSQILTSSYWIGSTLSKMQLTDWYVFVLSVTFIN